MSDTTIHIIIGIALGIVAAGLIIAGRRRYRDVFAVVVVLGIVALGATVTIYRVQQYDEQKTAAKSETAASQTPAGYGSSAPPAPRPAAPPINPRGGLSGAAAPEAAKNPYTSAGK